MMAMDAIRRLAKATARLNERSHLCDPDALDQRLLHRLLRRDEDRVHWIIRHSLPDVPVIENQRYPQLLELLLGTNPAQ